MMYDSDPNGHVYAAAAKRHQKLRRSKKSLDNWYEIKNALSNKEYQMQQQQQLLLYDGQNSDRNSYYSNDGNSTSRSNRAKSRPKSARKSERHYPDSRAPPVNRFVPICRPRHKSVESSELSSNNLTCSDLDTISNTSYSDVKLQRKALIKAILKEDVDLLKNLLPQHDLLSIKDKHRNTLMHIACGFGRLKSAQLLLKMCPKLIDQIDDKGHNPIDVAIKHGQMDMIKWVFTKTNKLIDDYQHDSSNMHRRTYLHFAAKHGENEILRFILTEMYKHQLSLDLQDSNGNTAAHLAAKYNHLDCLQTLVEFNCDVTVVNKNGHTPCFVAEFFGNEECVHYLMIVETCINLSIKVVKLSRRLRETKSNNEILKAQMDEAIAINNDFINQRENVMNISLDLMQRQLNQLETKIFSEIDKLQLENRRLNGHIHDLIEGSKKSNRSLVRAPQPAYQDQHEQTEIEIEIENFDSKNCFSNTNGGTAASYDSDETSSIQRVDKEITTINFDENQMLTDANHTVETINFKNRIKTEIIYCKEELINTKENCSKVLRMDQKKLDNVKSRFNQIKNCIEAEASMKGINFAAANFDHDEILENKEHLEVLRKMYQEATHKLMIFRNALRERQVNPKLLELPAGSNPHSNVIYLTDNQYKLAPKACSELSPAPSSSSTNSNSSSQTLQSSSIMNQNEVNNNDQNYGQGVVYSHQDPHGYARSNMVNVQHQLSNRSNQATPRSDAGSVVEQSDTSRRSGDHYQSRNVSKKSMDVDEELTHSSELLEPPMATQKLSARDPESSAHSNVPQSFDCRAQFEYSSDEDVGDGDVDGNLNEYNQLEDADSNILNARIDPNSNLDEDYLQYSIEEDENDVEDAENIFSQYEAYQKSKSSINNQDTEDDFHSSWRSLVNKMSPYQFNLVNGSGSVNQQPVMYRRSDHRNYNQFNLNEVIIEEEEEEDEDTEIGDDEDSEGNQEVAEINVNKVCSEGGSMTLHDLSKQSAAKNPNQERRHSLSVADNKHVNVSMNGSASSRSSQSSSSMSNHSVKSAGSGPRIKSSAKNLSC